MLFRSKFTVRLVFIFALLACNGSHADASSSCHQIDRAKERGKLQRLLSSSGVSRDEQTFLLAGADQRLTEIRPEALNEQGTQCGIDSVRALVLGCLSSTLPSAIRSEPANRKSSKPLWGRAGLSSHAAVFIGMFHACRGSAAEIFLSD